MLEATSAKTGHGIQKPQLAAIPLLGIHAGTLGQAGGPFTDLTSAAMEQVIAAPVTWCPNPAHTNCLRVKGTSMNPYIEDGDMWPWTQPRRTRRT